MSEPRRGLTHDTPAIYQIRLQGELDERLIEYLEMEIIIVQAPNDPHETILRGWLADQAALLGVLNNIYDMGYSLLSVECLEFGFKSGEERTGNIRQE